MHTQEVLTVITRLPESSFNSMQSRYPELDSMLNNGMYIASCKQTPLFANRYMLRFAFRPVIEE